MADPFTLANIAASCVWGLITGPFGNRADAAAVAGARKLADMLAGTQTPANHDVLRATHAAWLKSVQVMAQLAAGATTSLDDLHAHKKLAAAARSDTLKELRFDAGVLSRAELDRVIGDIYREDADPQREVTEAVIARVEIEMGEPLTEGLKAVFRDGHAGKPGWAATFQLFFAEAVKNQDAVFRVLAFERLNEVAAFARTHAAALGEIEQGLADFRGEMRDRLDHLSALLQEIKASQGTGDQASLELLRSLADAYDEPHDENDLEKLRNYLLRKVDEWREYRRRLTEIETEGEYDKDLLVRARAATDQGDFGLADRLLAQSVERLRAKSSALERRIAQHLAARAANQRLSGHLIGAAQLYDEAAATDEGNALQWRMEAAHIFSELANMRFDQAIREEAVRRWRALRHSTSEAHDRWFEILNELGNCLRISGTSASLDDLKEAIGIFRSMVAHFDKNTNKVEWAKSAANLGMVLRRRADRTDSIDDLVEASDVLRESVSYSEAFDMDLAKGNYVNLANSLRTLGDATKNMDVVRESVTWYHKLSDSYSDGASAKDLALLYVNMGLAYGTLGASDRSIPMLRASAMMHAAARGMGKIMKSDTVQIQAMLNAMSPWRLIGEMGRRRRYLEVSIAYGRHIVEVGRADPRSVIIGQAVANKGSAQLAIARIFSDREAAQEAERSFEFALDIFEEHGVSLYIGHQRGNLDEARSLLAQLGSAPRPC